MALPALSVNLRLNILGLSAFYHDSSCCLLHNGNLIAAASEERFTRIKHDARIPVNAFRYCLSQANLIPTDLDCIAYYEDPVKKAGRQAAFGNFLSLKRDLSRIDPQYPQRMIRENLGFDGQILYFDHHKSHAASAYYYSGFQESAILTVDGVGEWATTTYGTGVGNSISIFESVDFPHSIGLLYAAITAFLGFRVNSGEYKVMGLAPYGKPVLVDELRSLISMKKKGQYRLNLEYFDFLNGREMYSAKLSELLRMQPRKAETELTNDHKNLAKSLQVLTEDLLLDKVSYLKDTTGMDNLAMAGGVAMNAVANRRIRCKSRFRNLFIQPAAGDAGACLGSAALAHEKLCGQRHSMETLTSVFLGPEFSNQDILSALNSAGIQPLDFSNSEEKLIEAVVDRLLANKIIGWFQGRMEFGPRALGARSILANPMNPEMRDRINKAVKKREAFRPFAATILYSHLSAHLDITHHVPFMIETTQVTSEISLPAITHVDGSTRPQSITYDAHPRFTRLLEDFNRRTGCPLLVNTSFNQRGEPIVCTPEDALICMGTSDLDVLVIQDFIIDREQIPRNWDKLINAWGLDRDQSLLDTQNSLQDNLYSFG